jgi:endoglucanase
MVSHVDEDGLLSLHKLGDWTASTLVDQRVAIRSRTGTVAGVVGRRSDAGDPSWTDLYVDIGARGHDEALSCVGLGDPVVVVGDPVELAGDRIASRSCDNRVSLWAGLEALRALSADPPDWDVALVASVQEERSYAGARTSTARLAPDAALVLDVTWATDTPAANAHQHGSHPLGSGPAVMRAPSVHPQLFTHLVHAAELLGDPYTIEVAETSLTDADAVFPVGAGVATCVASIPMRRYHSPAETVQLSDVAACSRLTEAFARGLEPELDLTR